MGRFGPQPAALVVLAGFCLAAFAQQNPAAVSASTDAFLGRWELNVDKSSRGPNSPKVEMLTIEPQGKMYKIAFEASYPDGSNSRDWTVTDMKGWASTIIRKDRAVGATQEEWRVTRDGVDSFAVVAVFQGGAARIERRYTVSPDGQTLTRQTISGGPARFRSQVLVFDKVRQETSIEC